VWCDLVLRSPMLAVVATGHSPVSRLHLTDRLKHLKQKATCIKNRSLCIKK
jgi:hypothetical protein